MKTIAIVIGHGPKIDKGAFNSNGMSELEWNHGFANLIERALGNRAKAVIIHRQIERVPPWKEVNAIRPDLAVELHLNAYNSQASGTEMIYYPGSKKGLALAQRLQKAAVAVLGLPNRGVKTPMRGRGMVFLERTNCPAVIIESFFIDNGADLAVGNQKKAELAQAYADVLVA